MPWSIRSREQLNYHKCEPIASPYQWPNAAHQISLVLSYPNGEEYFEDDLAGINARLEPVISDPSGHQLLEGRSKKVVQAQGKEALMSNQLRLSPIQELFIDARRAGVEYVYTLLRVEYYSIKALDPLLRLRAEKRDDGSIRDAYRIHQFLMRNKWINPENFALRYSGGSTKGSSTVIIDEASMIPIDLLGVLFRALDLNQVSRLILVGDPNQLPPIGPGRPELPGDE